MTDNELVVLKQMHESGPVSEPVVLGSVRVFVRLDQRRPTVRPPDANISHAIRQGLEAEVQQAALEAFALTPKKNAAIHPENSRICPERQDYRTSHAKVLGMDPIMRLFIVAAKCQVRQGEPVWIRTG